MMVRMGLREKAVCLLLCLGSAFLCGQGAFAADNSLDVIPPLDDAADTPAMGAGAAPAPARPAAVAPATTTRSPVSPIAPLGATTPAGSSARPGAIAPLAPTGAAPAPLPSYGAPAPSAVPTYAAPAAPAYTSAAPVSGIRAKVASDKLNVRAGPNTETFEIVTTLTRDTDVVIIGETKDGWYKIAYPQGHSCYAPAKAFDKVDEAGIARGGVSAAAKSEANLHVRAWDKSTVVGKLGAGEVVQILGASDGFYKIVPPASAGVWVASKFLTKVDAAASVPVTADAPKPGSGTAKADKGDKKETGKAAKESSKDFDKFASKVKTPRALPSREEFTSRLAQAKQPVAPQPDPDAEHEKQLASVEQELASIRAETERRKSVILKAGGAYVEPSPLRRNVGEEGVDELPNFSKPAPAPAPASRARAAAAAVEEEDDAMAVTPKVAPKPVKPVAAPKSMGASVTVTDPEEAPDNARGVPARHSGLTLPAPEKVRRAPTGYLDPLQGFTTGWVEYIGFGARRPAAYRLVSGGEMLFLLRSSKYDLRKYVNQRVAVDGTVESAPGFGANVMVVERMRVMDEGPVAGVVDLPAYMPGPKTESAEPAAPAADKYGKRIAYEDDDAAAPAPAATPRRATVATPEDSGVTDEEYVPRRIK